MKYIHLALMVVGGVVPAMVFGQSDHLSAAPPLSGPPRQAAPAFTLALPPVLTEGKAAGQAEFVRNGPADSPIQVEIRSVPPGALIHPRSVLLFRGERKIKFPVRAADNALVDLGREASLFVFQKKAVLASGTMAIIDNEPPPVMELSVPSRIEEGQAALGGRITIDRAAVADFKIALSAAPASEVGLTGEITMEAGKRSAAFKISATDDAVIDGDRPVTITARAEHGIRGTKASTMTVDNEERVLLVSVPGALAEGSQGVGRVTVGRPLRTKLEVALAATDASSLKLPSKVVIPAGGSSVDFEISAVTDSDPENDRHALVTAESSSFRKGVGSLMILDRTLASLGFVQVPSSIKSGRSFTVEIRGFAKSGFLLETLTDSLDLELILADGKVLPLPRSLAANPFWNSEVLIPSDVVGVTKIRAKHPSGIAAESPEFEVLPPETIDAYGEVTLATNDIAWDPVRKQLYASIPPTGGTHANRVVVIDPATREITGSVFVGQEPGQLSLTSDGSALYVARNANGSISRIDLPALTVGLTFAVGTSSNFGTLYAEDICTVAGQPNLLVVSQYRKSASPRHNGVAVFDNGVARTAKTQDHTGSNRIEASADPTLFLGYNNETTEFGLRHLRLSADGMTQETNNRDIVTGFGTDIQVDGNLLVATTGTVVEGATLRKSGTVASQGLVRPDLKTNRIFVLGRKNGTLSTHDKITAYDSVVFSAVRQYTLPTAVESPSGLIRWGDSGLAFRTAAKIYLIHDNRLIPSGPPADLDVSVLASANPASVGQAFNYTVRVRNKGPNPAYGTVITAALSANQTIGTPSSSVGTPTKPTGSTILLTAGDVAPGAEILLTIPATPSSAGSISCTAGASSEVTDFDQANNSGFKLVSVGFQSGPDTVNTLRLTASSLLHDSGRGLLWAAIPSSVDAPLGKSVVSIDPLSGLVSDPLPINAEPYANAMALSGNGKYLYVGLSDVSEVARIDLESAAKSTVRIPLGTSQWGGANFAQDIEVLDGDGTSFLIAGSGDHAAAVFDGAVRRTNRTGIYSVDRVEPSGTPGVYIGYNSYTSGYDLTRLQIASSGVSEIMNVSRVITGYYVEIEAEAGWILSSNGRLVNAATLALEADLGVTGRPCLDVAKKRAYLVNGKQLRAFDITNGEAAGSLTLPTTATGDWAKQCVRWGTDGFAVLGPDTILVARWSQAAQGAPVMAATAAAVAPTGLEDSDNDGIADGLEWLLGTPPDRHNANPVTIAGVSSTSPQVLHVAFPRRVGVIPGSYGFETSADLRTWTPAGDVVESVTGTATVDGVTVEQVNAAVPVEPGPSRFVRLRWSP